MNCTVCTKLLRKDNTRNICYKCWPSTGACAAYKAQRAASYRATRKTSPAQWKLLNAEKVKTGAAQRYLQKREQILAHQKLYYQKNKEARLQYQKDNREKINARQNERMKTDLNFKLAHRLRNRILKVVKQFIQSGTFNPSAIEHLGCTLPELKVYLESKFQPGMSWSNWTLRGWHIDHIKPLCSFILTDPDQFKAATHFSNLQPLWSTENLSKNARQSRKKTLTTSDQPLLP